MMPARYANASRIAAGLLVMALSGCASIDIERAIARTNDDASGFTQGQLELAQTAEQRADRSTRARSLLAQPLSQSVAVQLALVNSPALQALVAQSWAEGARVAQAGRMSNPIFSFERTRQLDELELGRLLSFGLLDLLTLPTRYGIAQTRLQQTQVRLTLNVVDQVTQVRAAWVRAVAAQQSLVYARQVNDVAQASAELAARMQAAGNFSRLQRARQQAFYADAAAQWAAAQQTATATREALVRLLGLDDAQAQALQLPERLPDLPKSARNTDEVSRSASTQRLDIRLAQTNYDATARAQGITTITSLTDIELGVRRDTVFDDASGRQNRNGFEVSVRLPVFDSGAMVRSGLTAQTLAAINTLEATMRAAGSNLRQTYTAYRTAFDMARHYRDEIVPLRQLIADENVLRYNGMLIGVFELLAESRAQIESVRSAIAAEQQFWLADAALQASIVGQPMPSPSSTVLAVGSEGR